MGDMKYKVLKNYDILREFSTLLIGLQCVILASKLILTGKISQTVTENKRLLSETPQLPIPQPPDSTLNVLKGSYI